MSVPSLVRRTRSFIEARRELLLLIPLTLSGLTFAYFAFQPAPPNPAVQASIDAQYINAAEQRAITTFQAILKENRAGTLSDLGAAARVESEVLPIWKAARQRIAVVRAGPGAEFFPPEIDEFFRLRQESWEALVTAVKNDDEAALETQRAKWQAADAIVQKLRTRGTAASR
jgi:hypothetical protein